MFLFVGLGNPGPRYVLTRHNVGFLFIDELIENAVRKTLKKKSYEAYLLEGPLKVYAAKPLTYMNLSGIAVRSMFEDLSFGEADTLVVVHDDIWIPLGRIRIRENGSAGGHNGLKSIISELNTQDFPRIRIGVGPMPENHNMIDYVLGQFSNEEYGTVNQSIDVAVDAAREIIRGNLQKAMTRYNGLRTDGCT